VEIEVTFSCLLFPQFPCPAWLALWIRVSSSGLNVELQFIKTDKREPWRGMQKPATFAIQTIFRGSFCYLLAHTDYLLNI
jgi:hypothetical protein